MRPSFERHDKYTSSARYAVLERGRRQFLQGIAAGLQAWLKRHVNVDHVEGVWYVTIEDMY